VIKIGPGEYGEGDIFLGIRVPVTRKVARKFRGLPFTQVLELLKSKYHEERLLALFMLVALFKKGNDKERKNIYDAYLDNTDTINNWDLVDGSAHQIVGGYLFERDRRPLYELAKSKSLWERRISIITTYHFIRKSDFADTLKLSEILLPDKEDLIHKAVGWMLREIGKLDLEVAPSSTWTYLINDNTFEGMLGVQLIGNPGLQVGAGIWWPLMLFFPLVMKLHRKNRNQSFLLQIKNLLHIFQ